MREIEKNKQTSYKAEIKDVTENHQNQHQQQHQSQVQHHPPPTRSKSVMEKQVKSYGSSFLSRYKPIMPRAVAPHQAKIYEHSSILRSIII